MLLALLLQAPALAGPPTPYVATEEVLGTPHPIFPQGGAPDGSWIAACQARADTTGDGKIEVMLGYHGDVFGDARALSLLDAAHPEGMPLDRFIATDDAGRWLVAARGGRLLVRDMRSGAESDLGPDTLPTDARGLHERSANLDAAGTHLAYLRGVSEAGGAAASAVAGGGGEQVVIRDLATGAERVLDTGGVRVWRASFAAGGWVAVAAVPADTDGDGVITLPALRTTLAGGACRGEVMSYSTYGYAGDAFEWRLYRLADGVREVRPIVADVEQGLLVREADGALTWLTTREAPVPLVPASCGGAPVGVWGEGPTVLMACGAEGARKLVRYDRAGAHDVPIAIDAPPRRYGEGRILPLGDDVLDLATGRTWPRAYGGEEGQRGDVLLEVDKTGAVTLRDLATGEVRALTAPTKAYVYGRQFGRYVALTGEGVTVIDLDARRVVGTLPRVPIRMRDDGAALLAESEEGAVSRGPLRWWRPGG